MYKLAYVFGTRNNPDLIEYYINVVADTFQKNNIGLYILDGSDSDETSKIIENKNFDFIHYYFMPNVSLGIRVLYGFNEADSHYICYGGDSQIPILDKFGYIDYLLDQEYDLITLTYRDNKNIKKKIYNDITEMFKDNAWDMTLGGSVFLKKSSYLKIDIEKFKSKYKYDFLAYMIYYFDYFDSNNNFKGLYEACPIIYISPLKKQSNWHNNIFDVWGVIWAGTINSLDRKYNSYKSQVIKDHGIYSSLKLNKIKTYMRERSDGRFNYSDYKKYKSTIYEISDISHWKLYLLLCIPICFLKIAIEIYRYVKRNV